VFGDPGTCHARARVRTVLAGSGRRGAGQLGGWALPRDIIEHLGLPKNGVTSASVSRALLNVSKRGLVARASGEVANVGKAFRYLRITDPVNALLLATKHIGDLSI
jgi:hypothetical protein